VKSIATRVLCFLFSLWGLVGPDLMAAEVGTIPQAAKAVRDEILRSNWNEEGWPLPRPTFPEKAVLEKPS